jgi:hypothetical protein
MLKIDLKVGESVRVGTAIITLEEKSGKGTRLAIQADRSIPVERVQQRTAASIAAATGINGKP